MKMDLGVRLAASSAIMAAALLSLSGCGGSDGGSTSSGGSSSSSASAASCDIAAKEAAITAAFSAVPAADLDVDFSYAAERSDGRRFVFNRGASTMTTAYESASTSKMMTAIIILRLVDQGYLKLTDRPQDKIAEWPIASTDPLYNMTLAQLLSFTSGLEVEPGCINLPNADMASCVSAIATSNANNGVTPGTRFYYDSSHMQVAGLMAIRARGLTSWADLFNEFRTQTGLFPTGVYDLPSVSNPRLAGGMHWKATEYLDFLKALKSGNLLTPPMMSEYLADRTAAPVTMAYSPLQKINEDWHYGLGHWHECQSATWNCQPMQRTSSPGAFGAYPYWDHAKSYIGIVARQGGLGTYTSGLDIERTVRPYVEAWAACQ